MSPLQSLKVSYEKYTDENDNEQYNLDCSITIKELEWTFKEWDFIKQKYVGVWTPKNKIDT